MQRGSIFKRHGAWHLVYRITEVISGQLVRKQITRRLASVTDEYRSVRDVRPLADEHLRPMNLGSITPEGSLTVSDFAKNYFLPALSPRRNRAPQSFIRTSLTITSIRCWERFGCVT
jgi:hypothetical protein